jgi:hypothetical protein
MLVSSTAALQAQNKYGFRVIGLNSNDHNMFLRKGEIFYKKN